jgi:predicted  nucleic acid-binding Zn-ribbon protein
MRSLLLVLITCSSLLMSGWVAAQNKTASKVIYRYKNNQGITVLDSTIPPEYVNKGYEIVSLSGKVIKVIAPVTQGEEGERLHREKLAREAREREDVQLHRSYSNVTDIDAAKNRNLESLRGNINILQANLVSARSRLQGYQSQAAAIERGGRQLPEDLLKNINNLVQEDKDIQEQILQREEELKAVEKKFDEDRKRFIEITQ